MQDLKHGDMVKISSDSFYLNGQYGRVIDDYPSTEHKRIINIRGSVVYISINELEKVELYNERL